MAREGLRSHLSGSVPISIGVHLVALLLVLIIPLVADVSVPRVWVDLPDYVRLAPMPPPPPAITVRSAAPKAAPGPVLNRAPTADESATSAAARSAARLWTMRTSTRPTRTTAGP